ncbi:hypothetical protein ASZ90_016338 [hydrocarbon metagenome]|uniref:Uncharacterized protein n=1 Tax=hydrocarbon metagenome TaxID=938273 RepID=A0A0W8EZN8_9ZZZZ
MIKFSDEYNREDIGSIDGKPPDPTKKTVVGQFHLMVYVNFVCSHFLFPFFLKQGVGTAGRSPSEILYS